ncbi:hypothetical protein SMIR_42465 (plasmid) [Streptomyces mirabilis]|uniref:hypothetical protein n=1 Tax=Streptomyces mirabilis TaxID=68239 RepID=UPI001BAFB91B|nr:hypothetical protein [Streptomyces mirabilis]QUW85703.1 hypothetical protein SMIR_42465 [Streptomyces mirabilis]
MSVWVLPRSAQRGRPLASVIAVVLLGLVHLLGCAHGPQLTGSARADTVPITTAAHALSAANASAEGSRLPSHPTVECSGEDTPAVAAQRVTAPAAPMAVCTALALSPVEASLLEMVMAAPPRAGPGEGGAPGRRRAALGVWRT